VTKARRNSRAVLRKGRVLGALIAVGFAMFAMTMAALREEQVFAGPFRVVDGDTLASGNHRLRLLGIDAPELAQTCGGEETGVSDWPCGRRARQVLFQLITEGPFAERVRDKNAIDNNALAVGALECRGTAVDRYGRFLVLCDRADRSINAAMVRAGMAVATGSGNYAAEQALAQKARAGLWRGSFETPRLWRQNQGLQQDEEDAGHIWQRVTSFLQAL
jgi:endonuclease YncB( thermonuclease family)